MKRPEISDLDLARAALIVEVKHPPQFEAIEFLSIHEAADRSAKGFVHVAHQECPESPGKPHQIAGHAIDPWLLFNARHGQRRWFPLNLVHDAPPSLVCTEQMVTDKIVPIFVHVQVTVERTVRQLFGHLRIY